MAVGKQGQNDREAFKLVLSLRHVVMAGLGLTVAVVWFFVLGVLVGKGEVGRLLTGWGLLQAEAPARTGIPAVPPSPPEAASTPGASQAETASPAPLPPAQTAKPAPQASAAVPVPAPEQPAAAPAPKDKTAKSAKTAKPADKTKPPAAKEKSERELMAAKLKFQNSFAGTPAKPAKPGKAVKTDPAVKAKAAPEVQPASMVGAPAAGAAPPAAPKAASERPKSYRVKLGTYRTQKEAQEAVEDLKKKGVPVSLAPGKDKQGAVYVVKTGKLKTRAEAETLTRKLQGSRYQGHIEETP